MKLRHLIVFGGIFTVIISLLLFLFIVTSDDEEGNINRTGTGGSLEGNALLVYQFYSEKGVDDLHIAAILGNLYQESKLDPNLIESNGEGIGLVQWSFGRKKQFLNYCTGLGVQWKDIKAQLNFSWFEFDLDASQKCGGAAEYQWIYNDDQRSKKAFEDAATIEAATTIYCHGFERCGLAESSSLLQTVRIPKAKEFYEMMQSGNGTPLYFDNATTQKIMDEALKYQGWKYVFGGDNPNTSFDCSGLVQWCYGKAGINLPRTAQMQYDATQHIPLSQAEPGDLVFFHSTYNSGTLVTHVGIYQGNNRMYHAGNPIGYADLTTAYWQQHLLCGGRVKSQ